MVRLGDICRKITDGTHHSPVNRPVGPFKYITAKNIKPWGLDLSDITYVDEPTHREIFSRCDVQPNDVLLVKDGATTGRVAVNTLQEPFSLLSSVGVLRPGPNLEPRYLAYALQSPAVQDAMFAKMSGVAITRLTLKKIKELEVPIVSLDEQRRIVADIDKQFSRLDEAVANLQRVKANLKRYKAAVLKAAVEGRLVETEASIARREGRGYETGDQLLQRILAERRVKWAGKGKYKEPVEADAACLGVLPEGWVTASLDMISTDSGYGTSQKCGYENDGLAVLRIPNVQHGVLDLQDLKFAPTEFKLGQSDAVSSGDMLIIRTNGSKSLIGRAAVVMAEPQRKMSFASYLIRFRLSSADCIPPWVSVVWQTSQMREWIEAHAATSAGQHNVSMTVLAKAAIPVPPVTEQARILSEVDRHLSIIREVEAEVDANLQRAQALRQATLAKAFSSQEE